MEGYLNGFSLPQNTEEKNVLFTSLHWSKADNSYSIDNVREESFSFCLFKKKESLLRSQYNNLRPFVLFIFSDMHQYALMKISFESPDKSRYRNMQMCFSRHSVEKKLPARVCGGDTVELRATHNYALSPSPLWFVCISEWDENLLMPLLRMHSSQTAARKLCCAGASKKNHNTLLDQWKTNNFFFLKIRENSETCLSISAWY